MKDDRLFTMANGLEGYPAWKALLKGKKDIDWHEWIISVGDSQRMHRSLLMLHGEDLDREIYLKAMDILDKALR
jgi:hypothetical protein